MWKQLKIPNYRYTEKHYTTYEMIKYSRLLKLDWADLEGIVLNEIRQWENR